MGAISRELYGVSVVLLLAALTACSGGHLRGQVSESADGKTYFALLDDAGGSCARVMLDGVRWPHPVGAYAEIEPGMHVIECHGEIALEVPAGTRFGFDYWGP